MSVMRALDEAEYLYTRDGKRRVTHEAYSYMITPFAYPPIKVLIYKGHIDPKGVFQAVDSPKDIILTQEEFKELLSPNAHGKPAGDFRLSDILRCLKRRNAPPAPPAEVIGDANAKPAGAKTGAPANADSSEAAAKAVQSSPMDAEKAATPPSASAANH